MHPHNKLQQGFGCRINSIFLNYFNRLFFSSFFYFFYFLFFIIISDLYLLISKHPSAINPWKRKRLNSPGLNKSSTKFPKRTLSSFCKRMAVMLSFSATDSEARCKASPRLWTRFEWSVSLKLVFTVAPLERIHWYDSPFWNFWSF